jgi:pSer/pThr/pTyr-binding forkhead associated (FHA) protein
MIGILEFAVWTRPDRSVPLRDGDSFVIGRGPYADVSFDITSLSRQHCRVWAEGGQAWIENMGCAGIILVNRTSVRGSCVLRLGDLVDLGGLSFRLQPCPATATARAESPTPANQSEGGTAFDGDRESKGLP